MSDFCQGTVNVSDNFTPFCEAILYFPVYIYRRYEKTLDFISLSKDTTMSGIIGYPKPCIPERKISTSVKNNPIKG